MIKACWNHERARQNILFDYGEGAGWALLLGLGSTDSELVKAIWRGSLGHDGTVWVSMIEYFPALLPAGSLFDDLRAEMLARARTDERLFAAVRELDENGHQPFLHSWIREHLRAGLPANRALALTAAGFLDADDDALALWNGTLAASPGPGWLATLYLHSHAAFQNGRSARHWYRALSEAPDEEEAVRALRLLDLVADDRVQLFFRKPGLKVKPDSWRARWLDFLRPYSAPRRERFGKSMEKTWMRSARPSDILKGY